MCLIVRQVPHDGHIRGNVQSLIFDKTAIIVKNPLKYLSKYTTLF